MTASDEDTSTDTISSRRTLLKATGVAVASFGLTGCSTRGSSDGSKYNPENTESLWMDVEVFPEGWKRLPKERYEGFTMFANEDEYVIVGHAIVVFENVEKAKSEYEKVKSESDSVVDYDLADAAFWVKQFDVDTADTVFRDSNASARVVARSDGIPDVSRSNKYAEKLYDHWREISGSSTSTTTETTTPIMEATTTTKQTPLYNIIDREDISIGTTVRLKIQVQTTEDVSTLSREEFRLISEDIVERITSQKDVNSISIFFWEDNAIIGAESAYVRTTWAPDGDLDNAMDVETGDYSKHEYDIEFLKSWD